MAVELCKVTLWLEAINPGKPLSFLDHHIKSGNSLLGTTPALLAAGIPDTAYTPLTGDDKKTATSWRKLNAAQRDGQQDLFGGSTTDSLEGILWEWSRKISDAADASRTLADVEWSRRRYAELERSKEVGRAHLRADGWCAALLGAKLSNHPPIVHDTLSQLATGKPAQPVQEMVEHAARRHRLFHWHLEFPEIFGSQGDSGHRGAGFSAVLGNPPWEQVKVKEREFFDSRDSDIAKVTNASQRKDRIGQLQFTNPPLYLQFYETRKKAEREIHFYCNSGRFPLAGRGDVNTYSLFIELARFLVDSRGMVGLLAPTGLATDSTTSDLFSDILASGRLAAFYDFENNAGLFTSVSPGIRFCAIGIAGDRRRVGSAPLAFALHKVSEAPTRAIQLAADEVLLLNPTTGTLPMFPTARDASITLEVYQRHGILQAEGPDGNPWSVRLRPGLYHMTSDSGNFVESATNDDLAASSHRMQPLYEGKLISHYDHRANYYSSDGTRTIATTLDQHRDPHWSARPRYLVRQFEAERRSSSRLARDGWHCSWALCWRNITSSSSQRVLMPSVVPVTTVGNSLQMMLVAEPMQIPLLQAVLSSLPLDYLARQKLSGNNLTLGLVKQLAFPRPQVFAAAPAWSDQPLSRWIRDRVLELAYTSWSMRIYAQEALGDFGGPFAWDEDRRRRISAELDAALMHTYGLLEDDAAHVLSSFEALQRAEEKACGSYMTMTLVLTAYRQMAKCAGRGTLFRSSLTPPPGRGPRHSADSLEVSR